MTDPSYKGQFVAFTYPHIGNVGINPGARRGCMRVWEGWRACTTYYSGGTLASTVHVMQVIAQGCACVPDTHSAASTACVKHCL